MLNWISKHLTWSKDEIGVACPSQMDTLNRISEQLISTVSETKDISSRIISKLEAQIEVTEAKLSDREQLLSAVFDTIPDFLCLKDPQGRWMLLNSAGKKMFGLSRAGEYKEKTNEQIAEISARYKSILHAANASDNLAWERRSTVKVEECCVDGLGQELILEVSKTPVFDDKGHPKHLLVHGVNITEAVQSTRHIGMLVHALNCASDSVIVTDSDHSIVYANDSFCSKHGYDLSEVLNHPISMVETSFSDEVRTIMKESISKGASWTGELIYQHKNGSSLRANVTVTPIMNGKPYPIYYIVVLRGIN